MLRIPHRIGSIEFKINKIIYYDDDILNNTTNALLSYVTYGGKYSSCLFCKFNKPLENIMKLSCKICIDIVKIFDLEKKEIDTHQWTEYNIL